MGDVLYTSGASENLNNAFMDRLANSVWITDGLECLLTNDLTVVCIIARRKTFIESSYLC